VGSSMSAGSTNLNPPTCSNALEPTSLISPSRRYNRISAREHRMGTAKITFSSDRYQPHASLVVYRPFLRRRGRWAKDLKRTDISPFLGEDLRRELMQFARRDMT